MADIILATVALIGLCAISRFTSIKDPNAKRVAIGPFLLVLKAEEPVRKETGR